MNVQLTGVRINDPDEIFSYNGNENGVVQPDEDGQYCIRAKSEEESKNGSADVFLSFAGVLMSIRILRENGSSHSL